MFQYEWVDKKIYKRYNISNTIKHENHKLPIEYIRIAHWEEHCLECGAPECYETCLNYIRRFNSVLCRKLTFGYHENKKIRKKTNNLFIVDIRFEKWGKIETPICRGVIKPKHIAIIYSIIKAVGKAGVFIFTVLKCLSDKWILMYYFHTFQRKILNRLSICDKNITTDHFMISCYSYTELQYSLIVQILVDSTIMYRNSILIQHGYNEKNIKIPFEQYQNSSRNGLLQVYPENNINAEMTIYFLGLVKLFPTSNKNEQGSNKKLKCVVWDLDNTLWNGILIESDPSKIALRDGILKIIVSLDERGVLQSIASKNDEKEAMPVLRKLGIDQYFLYPMINWDTKSSNIKKVSELLNIDVNTFGFIDDSSFERAEVSANLPTVKIYDEAIVDTILDLPETDIIVTDESRSRRLMYQTENKRIHIQQNNFSNNYIDFLKNCEIKINIEKPNTKELATRGFELIQRTNQLNLSGKKYNRIEFDALLQKNDIEIYIVHCEDKYGTYGYIAFFTLIKEEKHLYIDEFAMSCRVAKKYVESGIIFWLVKKYIDIDNIILRGNKTDKNKLLISSFTDIGFQYEYNGNMFFLLLPVSKKLKNSDVIGINCEY